MEQELFNWLVAGISGLLGFFLRVMWGAVKDLQEADENLVEKVNHIEVLVAGNYINKDEFNRFMERLYDKLDSIENKLDHKVDK